MSFNIPESEKNCYSTIFNKFNDYFTSTHNKIHARAKFNKLVQEVDERIEEFLVRIYSTVALCQYPANIKDELIRDRIIVGIKDIGLSNNLQLDPNITLDTVLTKVRQSEEIYRQKENIRPSLPSTSTDIQQVDNNFTYNKKNKQTHVSTKQCGRCGKSPPHAFYKCPAKLSVCSNCKKKGHWAQKCRNSKKVFEINDEIFTESDNNNDEHYLGSIAELEECNKNDPWRVEIRVYNEHINFKIDSGADVTAIGNKHFVAMNNIRLQEVRSNLRAAAKSKLSVIGKFSAKLFWKNNVVCTDIYVIQDLEEPLLGKPAIEGLGLISRIYALEKFSEETVTEENAGIIENQYPRLFQGLGKLNGEYEICINPNSKPYAISYPRRIAIPLYEPLKKEIKLLIEQGVIFPVDEPTDYCAAIVVRPKEGGNIRLCVDYTELNKNIRRSRYQLPSVDECLAQIGYSQVFSKLDANKGYFQLPLKSESKLLTTFITPFGRFAFHRMPMGIACASEVFQKKIQTVIDNIPGVICCQDDILITGRDVNEHDLRLKMVLDKMLENGITLNKDKCKFRVKECTFLGHKISNEGIKPCEEKVRAITDMPKPHDVTTVRSLLGMVNYHLKFLPNLSTITKPIRDLLHKDKDSEKKKNIIWSKECDSAFDEIKKQLAKPTLLALFNPNKKIRVIADASSYGLGAILEQFEDSDDQWRPVCYASRSLTPTEINYAQIEKEALASAWACEKFSMYLLGLPEFDLRTDHQPLVTILGSKPISELSARMQRFRLRMLQFRYKMTHIPGKMLYTADLLSRAPLKSVSTDKESNSNDTEITLLMLAQLKALPISDKLLNEIGENQGKDNVCDILRQYVLSGWPKKHNLDENVRPFYRYRGEIVVQRGLLMRGYRILIPQELQKDMLKRLHQGHLGIDKCRNRAKESIWWPGISSSIKVMVDQCPECIERRINPTQPLIPSDIPTYPWEIVAIDLFTVKQRDYMVTIDYYSKFPEVTNLTSTTSKSVILHLKSIFARYGIPKIIRSDNGPQFDSEDFKGFCKDWCIVHRTSSPHAPWSNGMAEAGVKIVKNIILKSENPLLGLMNYRSTPLKEGYSPAQLLFGRRIRTLIPMQESLLIPKLPNRHVVLEDKKTYQSKTKQYYDKRHNVRELTELTPGTRVWDSILKTYAYVLSKRNEPRSYNLRTENGSLIRRNIKHLILANSNSRFVRSDTSNNANGNMWNWNSMVAERDEISNVPVPNSVSSNVPVPDPVADMNVSDGLENRSNSRPEQEDGRSYANVTRYGRIVRAPQRLVM